MSGLVWLHLKPWLCLQCGKVSRIGTELGGSIPSSRCTFLNSPWLKPCSMIYASVAHLALMVLLCLGLPQFQAPMQPWISSCRSLPSGFGPIMRQNSHPHRFCLFHQSVVHRLRAQPRRPRVGRCSQPRRVVAADSAVGTQPAGMRQQRATHRGTLVFPSQRAIKAAPKPRLHSQSAKHWTSHLPHLRWPNHQ